MIDNFSFFLFIILFRKRIYRQIKSIMQHEYSFLFKYIIIGDASIDGYK
jgi:hypothetical protein